MFFLSSFWIETNDLMNEFQKISIYIQAHNLSNIEEVTNEMNV